MTNKQKAMLRQLAKQGKTFKEIKEYDIGCADSTIKSYIKTFNLKTEATNEKD